MHDIQNLQGSATSRTKTQQGSNKPYLQDPHTVQLLVPTCVCFDLCKHPISRGQEERVIQLPVCVPASLSLCVIRGQGRVMCLLGQGRVMCPASSPRSKSLFIQISSRLSPKICLPVIQFTHVLFTAPRGDQAVQKGTLCFVTSSSFKPSCSKRIDYKVSGDLLLRLNKQVGQHDQKEALLDVTYQQRKMSSSLPAYSKFE